MHECEWCTNGLNQGLGHSLTEFGKSGTEKWLCNDLQNSPTTLNSSQMFLVIYMPMKFVTHLNKHQYLLLSNQFFI